MRVKLFEKDKYLLEWLNKYLTYKGYVVYDLSEGGINNRGLPHTCPCSKEDICADALLIALPDLTKESIQDLIRQEAQGCTLPRSRKGIMSECICSETIEYAEEQGFTIIKKPFKLKKVAAWLESSHYHSQIGL